MSKESDDFILVEYRKMDVLREVAKTMPNSQLEYTLKSLDKQWDEIMKDLQPPKKKKAFVTKF